MLHRNGFFKKQTITHKSFLFQLYVSEVNKGVEYRYMYPVTDSETNIIQSEYKQDSKHAQNSLHAERDANSSPYGEREAYSQYAEKETYNPHAGKEAYSPYAERNVYSPYPSANKPSRSRHNSFNDIQENR